MASSPAWGTVPDKFGLGARSMGAGGGGVALVDDGTSAMVNPAGLSRIRQPTTAVGLSAAVERFDALPDLWWDTNQDGTIDDRDAPLAYDPGVDDAIGIHFFMGRNVGGKFGLGLAGYLPANRLLRFSTFESSLPTYFMHHNRPQRYAMAAGIGGEIFRGVNIGAGVEVLASAHLNVEMTVDLDVTGNPNSDRLEDLVLGATLDLQEISLDVQPAMAPMIGLQLDFGRWTPKLEGLVVGARYRHTPDPQKGRGGGVPFNGTINAQINADISDVGDLEPYVIAALMKAGINILDHYVPPQLTTGVAYRTADTLSGYVDLRWTDWRAGVPNIAKMEDVEITAPFLELPEDAITDGNDYEITLKSVVSLRTGVELRLPRLETDKKWKYTQITVRGGFGYEPSPLVSQGNATAMLDADRMMFTLGAGYETWDPFDLIDAPVRFDAFFQYHSLASGSLPRASETPMAGFPRDTDTLPIGGRSLVFGGQWGFDY